MKSDLRLQQAGSSLVTTLLVITVLTIIVVTFMQSMSVERLTSRSYANLERASQAAESAIQIATARLENLLLENPFHAIGYQEDENNVPYPIFFGAENFQSEPAPTLLISTPELQGTFPEMDEDNSLDINLAGGASEPLGWIGSPYVRSGNDWTQVQREKRVPWIDILLDPSLPNQPDPAQPNFNPIVQRFAYWVEDETAKLDLLAVGNNRGPDGAFARETPVSLSPEDLDLGALPLQNGTPLAPGAGGINSQLVSFLRDLRNLPEDLRALNRANMLQDPESAANRLKFHTTVFSLSNELAGTGKRRANLNHIVTDSNNPDVIAADLDDIIFVITGRHIFAGSPFHSLTSSAALSAVYLEEPEETGPMPEFGRRFYTQPAMPTPGGLLRDDHQAVYLLKLAANIRDYIDSDSQPTFVNEAGQVEAGQRREFSWLSGEEPIAIGKEAIPYFQEHAWRARIDDIEIVPGTAPSNRRSVSFIMDHYFEFYNPSTSDFVAPQGTYLKVYNLPEFDANQFPSVELPDFEIDLSGVTFPAGTATVVTTAPLLDSQDTDDPDGLISPNAVVHRASLPDNVRIFEEQMGNAQVGGGTGDDRRFGLRMLGRDNSSTDYQSEFVFGTENGVLDAFPFITLAGTGSPFELTRSVSGNTCTWGLPEPQRSHRRHVWTHTLRGNDAVSRTGDPRSLSEPLELVAGSNAAFGNDQARFFINYSGLNNSGEALPGSYSSGNPRTTLGDPAMTEFVAPQNWPDYHVSLTNSQNTAYAVIADEPMQSIGELGHIYDPHRRLAPAADSPGGDTVRIRRARGGGRTLKIGQRDDLVPATGRFGGATEQNVSWFNGAWRLVDIFSAEDPDVVESAPAARGKINVNGVLRDDGTAFRAALRNLQFLPAPEGDTGRAGQVLSDSELNILTNQIINYLRAEGPMMCRGELGQIPFFSAAGANGTAGGQASSVTVDRGREEIFRRIAELITTRSLSYRIFAVGQSVQQRPDGTIVPLATQRMQSLVILRPEIDDAPNSTVTAYEGQIYLNAP